MATTKTRGELIREIMAFNYEAARIEAARFCVDIKKTRNASHIYFGHEIKDDRLVYVFGDGSEAVL